MAEKFRYLCIIVQEHSKETLLDLGEIVATDEYYARSQSYSRYTQHLHEHPEKREIPWAIESVELGPVEDDLPITGV